jgi:hypothetical protein
MATQKAALSMRLKIYLRRECYVWICRRGKISVSFGWVLGYTPQHSVLFKDDAQHAAVQIPISEIESCGAV